MRKAAEEAMRHPEKELIDYVRSSLQNMKSASSGFDRPLSDEGVLAMARVLREDMVKQFKGKFFTCLEGAREDTHPVYNDLYVFLSGMYKVWISKDRSTITICINVGR